MADRELLTLCDCHADILVATSWEEDERCIYFDFWEKPARGDLRWRVGAAWRVLRGKHWSTGGGGIALSKRAKVQELRDFLTECLDADS